MTAKKLPKFKGRRFTPECVIVWKIWDEVEQEYLDWERGGDDLDHEAAEERAVLMADAMEGCRPT